MPLTMEVEKIEFANFQKPMRAIFSGSSQSGKTFLIGKYCLLMDAPYVVHETNTNLTITYGVVLEGCAITFEVSCKLHIIDYAKCWS